jgi:hypothetical protein
VLPPGARPMWASGGTGVGGGAEADDRAGAGE